MASENKRGTLRDAGMFVGWGVILFAVIYLGTYIGEEWLEGTLYTWLYDRGSIPYLETFAFAVALAILLRKGPQERKEQAGMKIIREAFDNEEIYESNREKQITRPDVIRLYGKIRSELRGSSKGHDSMVVNRILMALRRFQNTHSSGEVDTVVASLSDLDRAKVESGYLIVKYLASLIPILGFFGTVYGMSLAIISFTEALNKATSIELIRPVLNGIAYNLGVAFDTTVVALAWSGIVLFGIALKQRTDENLLNEIDEFCLDILVSRLQILSSEDSIIEEGFRDTVNAINRHSLRVTNDLSSVNRAIKELAEESAGMAQGVAAVHEAIDKGKLSSITENMEKTVEELSSMGRDIDVISVAVRSGGGRGVDLSPIQAQLSDIVAGLAPLGEMHQRTLSIEDILKANIEGIKKTLHEIATRERLPLEKLDAVVAELAKLPKQFESLEQMVAALKQFEANSETVFAGTRTALTELKPALENLSAQTAEQVRQVLMQLLKVTAAGHQMDMLHPSRVQSIQKADFDQILKDLFR